MPRLHVAVGLLSVALIAFELGLMQVLSTVQWHHFAYMVISVALLGFGAAGTLLALAREALMRRFEGLLPLLMTASGAAMLGAVALSQAPFARFDSYLLFVEPGQAGALVLTYLLFFVPFLLGALAIGMVFVRRVARIGSYYFANLAGSGVGGLAAVALLWVVAPERLPAVTALTAVAAGLFVVPRRHRRWLLPAAGLAAALSVFFLLRPPGLAHSPYKDLSRTLTLPGAEVVLTRSSPHGRVEVVAAPALRYAPGLSLSFTGEVPVQQAVFNNGNWLGPVTAWTRGDTTHLLDYTTAALPYAMRLRAAVLVLHAGTGDDAAHAVVRGARRVVAVEPDGLVLDLLRRDLAALTDSLFYQPAVTARALEPRTYLAADTTRFDLVTLPAVGAFGGTVGLSALQEQYSLTKEGFRATWDRLTPGGAVAVTAWMDYPYRHALKVLATLVEVLEGVGVVDPAAHLAAVRSWGAVTFVLKKTPLAPEEIARIRRFCGRMAFDPLLLPGLEPGERDGFNRMPDGQFFAYVDQLLSADRERLYEGYDFAIAPATDDRPYFAQFLRWRNLPRLARQFGDRTVPFLEVGYLIAGVTFVQILLAALVLVLLPLLRLGWRGPDKGWTLAYFGSLGLGYLFVEIVLIQRFTLYLGHPLYAAAAVIATMLVCSGAGSYASERLAARRGTLLRVAGAVTLCILVYAVALTPLLRASIAWPLPLRALCAFALVAPPAFVMGMPFPLGLRWLSERSAPQVPWAWGVNGCLSVVSTAAAALLAVEAGFVVVMGLAAGAYALAAGVNARRG